MTQGHADRGARGAQHLSLLPQDVDVIFFRRVNFSLLYIYTCLHYITFTSSVY